MLSISICGTITLSQPDSIPELGSLAAPLCPPRGAEGPVFAEPWQAQAFALAVKLSEQGHFTSKEWATALADQLRAATSRGEPNDGSRYYHHWLAALAYHAHSWGSASLHPRLSSGRAFGAEDHRSVKLALMATHSNRAVWPSPRR
jgi:nitrile hydratase accessory protein